MATKILYFIRHANAQAVAIGTDDRSRPLSPKGEAQARERHAALGDVTFDAVFVSPALRTKQTGALITLVNIGDEERFHVVDELYSPPGEEGEILDAMFERLGNAPLGAYLEHPLNTSGTLDRFGGNGAVALNGLIMDKVSDETIAIVGHAVYLQAIVYTILMDGDQLEYADIIYKLDLAEAGVVKMVLSDDVTSLEILD